MGLTASKSVVSHNTRNTQNTQKYNTTAPAVIMAQQPVQPIMRTLPFRVDAKTHKRRRKFVGDMVEHGGNFYVDMQHRTVVGDVENDGRYSKIEMTRGVVDWHSHPRKCANANSCALGIPSPDDIENVITGHLYGNLGHLVYAKEGTYFIQLVPQLVHLLRCHYDILQRYTKDLRKLSNRLHRHFLRDKFPYKTYTKHWCDMMRACGLTIEFFKGNAVPHFNLYISDETQYSGPIEVPVDIKTDTTRLKYCPLDI